MKKFITLLTFVLSLSFLNAQKINEADVPSNVKNSFAKKYPHCKVDKWQKEEANYEAEFTLNKVESSALFDARGNFKDVEQEIKLSELPKVASDYCSKHFSAHKLSEAAKITDESGKVTYEAEMSKGKEHIDVIFDDKGNYVSQSAPTPNEEAKD
jgi:hypothetical protein